MGKIGEVCIRGPNVTAGYLNNPSANQEAFAGKCHLVLSDCSSGLLGRCALAGPDCLGLAPSSTTCH